jgi:hypothetical protein
MIGAPPPPKVLAIDVDKTLIINGKPNALLVEGIRLRHSEGFQIIVWSSRGEANSIRAVELCGLSDVVSYCISKPGYIVDDQGWRWIKYTRNLTARQVNKNQDCE